MGLLTAAPCCLEREARTQPRASLLPKVRDHFAEFLNQGSLVRLGLLDPSTGVGLRYGRWGTPQASLSWPCRSCRLGRPLPAGLVLASRSAPGGARLPTSLNVPRLDARHPARHLAWLSILANGAGISTCCPSPTPRGLGLGPTHPLRTNLAAETLDIRRWGFSPHESLLIPTFALALAPHRLTLMVLCLATLPYHWMN